MIDVPLRLLCLMALTVSLTSCIKENLDDCDISYSLTVRAYERGTEAELSADNITDLSLFVFNKDSRFLYKVETGIGEKSAISGPQGENLLVVTWGNLKQDHLSYNDPQPGDWLEDCFVELQERTRAESYALSPGDLFRGEITLTADDRTGDKILPVYREVGSMTVILRNLKQFSGYTDNDFYIVVRETPSRIGFDGEMAGAPAVYRPEGSFVTDAGQEVYYVPAFNMLSKILGVEIDIYHGNDLIATVSADRQRNPIIVEKDRLTNVLIDLRASVNVDVALTDWGNHYIWKEF